jgi:hypothetical protein
LPRHWLSRTLDGMDATHGPLPGTHAFLPGTQAPLPGAEAALVGLAALAVVTIPFLWRLASQIDTMAHEGAHAILVSALGFTVLGVTLDQNSDGATAYRARGGPARRLLIGFVGYLGPSAFGLGAAKLIETGHAVTLPWVAIVLLVLLMFLIRRSFGLISVPVAIALLVVVIHDAHPGLEEVVAYAMTWLLLLSGARTAVAHGAKAGDAIALSATTHLPRRLWALLWIAGTLLAVIIGAKWLILGS